MKVVFKIKDFGEIEAELYKDVAPITVDNFVKLVNKGFYNGLTFHRVIRGFMIQGGCPIGNGTGGPGYTIKGEFAANGVRNPLKHEAGVLSMARAMDPNSAGSQFFIMHEDAPHLDGQYASFGKVTTETVFSLVTSEAYFCIVITSISFAFFLISCSGTFFILSPNAIFS